MTCIINGLYVVQGEMAILLAAMRRGSRWSSHSQDYSQDVLIQNFNDLKDVLNQLGDLKDLDPSHYFSPFLEVIRAGGTTGPVTSLALSAIQKFLSYGLIEYNKKTAAGTVENIADAVTHTKFVSTDQNSDGVVLLKILQVLRILVLSPLGVLLTHESMCEIMLSCFRICFETRLTEHIRKSAEFCLKDIVQHLFTRLPEFAEDEDLPAHVKKIKMKQGATDLNKPKRKSSQEKKVVIDPSINPSENQPHKSNNIVDMQGEIHNEQQLNTEQGTETKQNGELKSESQPPTEELTPLLSDDSGNPPSITELPVTETEANEVATATEEGIPHDYVNQQGVRFTTDLPEADVEISNRLVPYGLGWLRELFRFLVSLCNPLDKMNTEMMIHEALTLLEVAFEVGSDNIGRYSSLLTLVKNELCRNLFSLLQTERMSIYALDIQVCFLMFESLRTHLKFQLENYLSRLTEMIVSDSVKITFEQKEIALEALVQLWRVPGLVTELYLNYDCDLYCPNVFEEITRMLSKNAFPVNGIYSTHLLSLDALLTIIDTIEEHCHNRILSERQVTNESSGQPVDSVPTSRNKCPRHPVSPKIPSHEELMAIKRRKKLLHSGTEQFNVKPKKGIQFLQEQHLLKPVLDPHEVVLFLRENPQLDKKMIGEYISNRSNSDVLQAFVKSFDFTDMRIDEALRLYLETFRLPGESPLIAMIMEYFADHWHKANGEPFVNADAAFTLAYAVIMLNVDQHNHNVKRQNNPMTVEEFMKNLKAVNGGQDFDHDMLEEIYNAIRNDEIVMPAEQTGIVKENYLWKVLLRRGAGKDGIYLHAPNGLYDHDLFSLIFSPTIAALSYVFDKSNDPAIYQKAISGYRKCAMISAHYGMSNDFDNLIVSLCKFSTLTNSTEPRDQLTISFGSNQKAQLAAKTLFNLTHRHGDILREGWSSVLDLVLVLYRAQLLPKCLIEAEDFLETGGKIQLVREEVPTQKPEAGLLSSIYSYIALGEGGKAPSPEEQEAAKQARSCIKDCRVEHIITESKFLRLDALTELVKALIAASPEPSSTARLNTDAAVFYLEMLLKVIIQNRDRSGPIWSLVRDHLYSLMMGGSACENHFLAERAIVGLLRLAIRLMRREEMSPVVLQSLRMLLLLKPTTLQRVGRQVAYGLNELIKTSAANIHTTTDWTIIFTLLECVGAGSPPPRVVGDPSEPGSVPPWAVVQPPLVRGRKISETKSDGDVQSSTDDSGLVVEPGYTSEPEPGRDGSGGRPSTGGWILVGRAGELQPLHPRELFHFDLDADLQSHDPFALVKCCETLAFLVRDVAHITPFNYRICVQCIRIFVEASLNGVNKKPTKKAIIKDGKVRRRAMKKREVSVRSPQLSPTKAYDADADESDSEEYPSGYHQITIQLLDLMHTLHTRTAQIHRWWAEEGASRPEAGSLWQHGWCPLLQGIARLCCDNRKQVRMMAITYLQRALLVHDLQTLTADEWENCFAQVLFPLLTKLLQIEVPDEIHLEETRVRAATVLSKVFLHHLTPLLSLPSFTTLWLSILDLMDKYMHVDRSDLLMEAIPESLKNMLLVMDSAQVFSTSDGYLPLWNITWDRISHFLPSLQEEFFKAQSSVPKHEEIQPIESPVIPSPQWPIQGITSQDVHVVCRSPDEINPDPSVSPPVDHLPSAPPMPNAQPYALEVGASTFPQPIPTGTTQVELPHAPVGVPVCVPAYSPPVGVRVESPQAQIIHGRPTSLILQPPLQEHAYTTPIFNHVGQQMPTTVIAANPTVPYTVLQTEPAPQLFSTSAQNVETLPQSPHHTSDASFSSPIRFGSHNSAFVPYVKESHETTRLTSPGRAVSCGAGSSTASPRRVLSPLAAIDSVVDLGFVTVDCSTSPPSAIAYPPHSQDAPFPSSLSSQDSVETPSDAARDVVLSSSPQEAHGIIDNIPTLDVPFFIPASSSITAPVQMFSGSHVIPSSVNNNDEPVAATSALSQYFNANYNQQHEMFDNLLASGIIRKSE